MMSSRSVKRRYSRSRSNESRGSFEESGRYKKRRSSSGRHGRHGEHDRHHPRSNYGGSEYRGRSRERSHQEERRKRHHQESPERSPSSYRRRSRHSYRSPSPRNTPLAKEGQEEASEVGCILKNRYRVINILEDSAYRRVVQAQDLEENQVVALEITKKPQENAEYNRQPEWTGHSHGQPQYGGEFSMTSDPSYSASSMVPSSMPASLPSQATGIRAPSHMPGSVPYFFNLQGSLPPSVPGHQGIPPQIPVNHPGTDQGTFSTERPLPCLDLPFKSEVPVTKSKVVQDFRTSDRTDHTVSEFKGHILELSFEQKGSRFLQDTLSRNDSPQVTELIFFEIFPFANEMMLNQFGNYIIQLLMKFGTSHHRLALFSKMKGFILPLSFDKYGCRVVQEAIETLPLELKLEIVSELKGYILHLVKHSNGNHVIQKAVMSIRPLESIQFIFDVFRGKVVQISSNSFGCRVIQNMISCSRGEQLASIKDEIYSNLAILIQSNYGNYVVQHMMKINPEDTTRVVGEIIGKMFFFSCHRFASNVVEACVEWCTRGERTLLLEEVLSSNLPHGQSTIGFMVKTEFANYAVQKLFQFCTDSQRRMIMDKLRPEIPSLVREPLGQMCVNKLKEMQDRLSKSSLPIKSVPIEPNN